MTEEEKQHFGFSMISKASWLCYERYRNGLDGLLDDSDTFDQLKVIEHVLTNLKYCTSNDIADAAVLAAKKIQIEWGLGPENTILVGVAEQNKTCGSTAYVRAIENCLDRSWGGCIHTTFVSAFRQRRERKNLIIVDDFIGTGNKIQTRIERLRRNPKTSDYVIYVLVFAAMNAGIDAVAQSVDNRIHTEIRLQKCITDALPANDSEKLAEQMHVLERKILDNENSKYSFGYEQTESAFFLEAANIPNNTFPILWWEEYADKSKRRVLFTRR